MYFGYYYLDPYYFFVLAAIIFSLIASARVNSVFRSYSRVRNYRGLTGADAARAVLSANGVSGVRIERVSGELTDHYDPKNNVIRLSESVYDSATVSAVGVAAHEAGHAVQYAEDYAPIKLRAAIVPATNFASRLSMPLIFIGLILISVQSLAMFYDVFYYLALAGALCYSLCVVFQLVTLPTEFNASRRALRAIDQSGLLSEEEQRGARKVLSAAAMTYVAALSVTLMQFLRLLLIVGGRRRRD